MASRKAVVVVKRRSIKASVKGRGGQEGRSGVVTYVMWLIEVGVVSTLLTLECYANTPLANYVSKDRPTSSQGKVESSVHRRTSSHPHFAYQALQVRRA